MSTLAYAQLTNRREASKPHTSTSSQSPGIRTYIDAMAALVPAEVLTLHGLIMTLATVPTPAGGTMIDPSWQSEVVVCFFALTVLAAALFALPRYLGGHWDRFDFVRMLIAPIAFVGWTMLQPMTAFDALPDIDKTWRTIAALGIGVVLATITAELAGKADDKPPPEPATARDKAFA